METLLNLLPWRVAEFIDMAFCRNRWCWLHGLGGALGGWIAASRLGLELWLIMLCALAFALLVETVEFWHDGTRPYTTKKRTLYDAAGDVIFALALCWIGAV